MIWAIAFVGFIMGASIVARLDYVLSKYKERSRK